MANLPPRPRFSREAIVAAAIEHVSSGRCSFGTGDLAEALLVYAAVWGRGHVSVLWTDALAATPLYRVYRDDLYYHDQAVMRAVEEGRVFADG